jgi:hypothetical protein
MQSKISITHKSITKTHGPETWQPWKAQHTNMGRIGRIQYGTHRYDLTPWGLIDSLNLRILWTNYIRSFSLNVGVTT